VLGQDHILSHDHIGSLVLGSTFLNMQETGESTKSLAWRPYIKDAKPVNSIPRGERALRDESRLWVRQLFQEAH